MGRERFAPRVPTTISSDPTVPTPYHGAACAHFLALHTHRRISLLRHCCLLVHSFLPSSATASSRSPTHSKYLCVCICVLAGCAEHASRSPRSIRSTGRSSGSFFLPPYNPWSGRRPSLQHASCRTPHTAHASPRVPHTTPPCRTPHAASIHLSPHAVHRPPRAACRSSPFAHHPPRGLITSTSRTARIELVLWRHLLHSLDHCRATAAARLDSGHAARSVSRHAVLRRATPLLPKTTPRTVLARAMPAPTTSHHPPSSHSTTTTFLRQLVVISYATALSSSISSHTHTTCCRCRYHRRLFVRSVRQRVTKHERNGRTKYKKRESEGKPSRRTDRRIAAD